MFKTKSTQPITWIRVLLGLIAFWLAAGGIQTKMGSDSALMEAGVYKIVFCGSAFLAFAALFLPVLVKLFRRFLLIRVLSVFIGAFTALILVTALQIRFFPLLAPHATGGERFAIVLGAPVVDNAPTTNLVTRVETTARWLQDHPQTKAVLTGGNGDIRTEAQVMHDLLVEAGISPDRLILENKATTTAENFQFSKEILQAAGLTDGETVAVITNEFHAYKASCFAAQVGMTNLSYVPARTSFAVRFGWYARETFSVIQYVRFRKLFPA